MGLVSRVYDDQPPRLRLLYVFWGPYIMSYTKYIINYERFILSTLKNQIFTKLQSKTSYIDNINKHTDSTRHKENEESDKVLQYKPKCHIRAEIIIFCHLPF